MSVDVVLARLQANPGAGWRADALARELALDVSGVETALAALASRGLAKRSVGGNWFVPKPPAEAKPGRGGSASHPGVTPDVPPGAIRVLLIHAPALAEDTVLHLSYREGSDHYRLRRYAGGDPEKHGKPYMAPGAKTVHDLRQMYGPFLRETDLTEGRDHRKKIDAWRQTVREINRVWGIDEAGGSPR